MVSIDWIKPEEVMKINEHVKLHNQMPSIHWIILFYLFYFYFPNTHSPSIFMMILNKRIKPQIVMKIKEH